MNWREPEIPDRYRKPYDRGRVGKAKDAIRAMCGMCCGWDASEVSKCTATGCPLFNLRNKSAQANTESADRAKKRARAIASGARPPQHDCAGGHGAHDEGLNTSAIDQGAP